MEIIPPEIVKMILGMVDKPSLVLVCQVCKLWNHCGKKSAKKIKNTIDVYDAYFNNDILALIKLFRKCGFEQLIDYRNLGYAINDAYREFRVHDYGVTKETWCVAEQNMMRLKLDKVCKWSYHYNDEFPKPGIQEKIKRYDTRYILNNVVIIVDHTINSEYLARKLLVKEYHEKVTTIKYISDDDLDLLAPILNDYDSPNDASDVSNDSLAFSSEDGSLGSLSDDEHDTYNYYFNQDSYESEPDQYSSESDNEEYICEYQTDECLQDPALEGFEDPALQGFEDLELQGGEILDTSQIIGEEMSWE